MPKSNNYADRIRKARSKLNLSQRQAAAAWGFNFRTLQYWEQGRNIPSGLYLEKLEDILKKLEQ